MKIVLDTNIVMDILANRKPFAEKAEAILNIATGERITAAITANTVTDIAYLLRKHVQNGDAIKRIILDLMDMVEVLDVDRECCIHGAELPMPDYEDAVLAVRAKRWNADVIITRNVRDFAKSPVRALSPENFLKEVKK